MTRTALSIPILLVMLFAAAVALFNAPPPRSDVNPEAAGLPAAVPEIVSRRCPRCGWIESKREVLAGYEYTVRMGDGTSSVFREELPVSWRLGERLIVIEGIR